MWLLRWERRYASVHNTIMSEFIMINVIISFVVDTDFTFFSIHSAVEHCCSHRFFHLSGYLFRINTQCGIIGPKGMNICMLIDPQ